MDLTKDYSWAHKSSWLVCHIEYDTSLVQKNPQMSATKFLFFCTSERMQARNFKRCLCSYFCLNAFTPYLNISKIYLLFIKRIGHKTFWILKIKHFCNQKPKRGKMLKIQKSFVAHLLVTNSPLYPHQGFHFSHFQQHRLVLCYLTLQKWNNILCILSFMTFPTKYCICEIHLCCMQLRFIHFHFY